MIVSSGTQSEPVRRLNLSSLSTHRRQTATITGNPLRTGCQTYLFGSFVQLALSCIAFPSITVSILASLVFRFSLRDLERNWHALKRLGVTAVLEKCVGVVARVCVCVIVCDGFHESAEQISTHLKFFCICIQMQPLFEFWIVTSSVT